MNDFIETTRYHLLDEVYKEGYRAYYSDIEINDNPYYYESDIDFPDIWLEGWLDACLEEGDDPSNPLFVKE